MQIGLTYDLRSEYLAAGFSDEETAEFDRESTVAALESAISQLGHTPCRIGHARQLVAKLAAGGRWDLVLNIAEGLEGIAREAQIPALLDVYGIPYTFSDPLVMALSLHKGLTKTVVQAAGVPTPLFAVVKSLEQLENLQLPYPLFAKPVAEGTGKGVTPRSKVNDPVELRAVCADLLKQFRQPVLIETFLSGREFTIGILGTGTQARVLASMEIILLEAAEAEVYSYVNKEECESRVEYRLVSARSDSIVAEAEQIALNAWRALNCRDGGRIDIRCDASDRPHFIEVNPLAGLHPDHSDLPILAHKVGLSYVQLIGQIIDSATRRIASSPPSLAKRFGETIASNQQFGQKMQVAQ